MCRDGEFEAEERFYSFRAGQAQAESAATVFQIQMKIEKGAAFGFRDGPVCEVGKGNRRGVELELVTVVGLGDLPARGNQAIGELLVRGAFGGIQGLDVAVEAGFRGHRWFVSRVTGQKRVGEKSKQNCRSGHG